MPRPRKNERVVCKHYVRLLGRRGGVWRADGRTNGADLGRHSLGTRDADEARRRLNRLDLTMAVKHGLADPAALAKDAARELPLDEGRGLYEAHAARARLVGGTRKSSQKRYRVVFDKSVEYARSRG